MSYNLTYSGGKVDVVDSILALSDILGVPRLTVKLSDDSYHSAQSAGRIFAMARSGGLADSKGKKLAFMTKSVAGGSATDGRLIVEFEDGDPVYSSPETISTSVTKSEVKQAKPYYDLYALNNGVEWFVYDTDQNYGTAFGKPLLPRLRRATHNFTIGNQAYSALNYVFDITEFNGYSATTAPGVNVSITTDTGAIPGSVNKITLNCSLSGISNIDWGDILGMDMSEYRWGLVIIPSYVYEPVGNSSLLLPTVAGADLPIDPTTSKPYLQPDDGSLFAVFPSAGYGDVAISYYNNVDGESQFEYRLALFYPNLSGVAAIYANLPMTATKIEYDNSIPTSPQDITLTAFVGNQQVNLSNVIITEEGFTCTPYLDYANSALGGICSSQIIYTVNAGLSPTEPGAQYNLSSAVGVPYTHTYGSRVTISTVTAIKIVFTKI